MCGHCLHCKPVFKSQRKVIKIYSVLDINRNEFKRLKILTSHQCILETSKYNTGKGQNLITECHIKKKSRDPSKNSTFSYDNKHENLEKSYLIISYSQCIFRLLCLNVIFVIVCQRFILNFHSK